MRTSGWMWSASGMVGALAIGCSVAIAGGEIIVQGGGGGPIDCTAGNCGNREKPTEEIDLYSLLCSPENVSPPIGGGGWNIPVFNNCVDEGLPASYVVTPRYDLQGFEIGVGITGADSSVPACIGVNDDTVVAGLIELRTESLIHRAKIFKFTDDPVGIAHPSIGGAASASAVHVRINGITIVVLTTSGMTAAQLNQTLDAGLRAQFMVSAGHDPVDGDYWMVHRVRAPSAPITFVSVRADDTGLVNTHVELGAPNAPCGPN